MYSQNNEDQIIEKYFGAQVGTFLDIGANDGITLSNVYALALRGWAGTCVEASPEAFTRLQVTHSGNKHIELIHTAVGSYNGKIQLHQSGEHLGTGDVALLSTVKQSELDRWLDEVFETVTVPCVNFNTLLGLSKHKKFDFISMDIEGMELEVLPKMDLQILGCKLLCVEFNGKEQDKYDAIVLPQGYKLIHKNAENLIYAKN